MPSRVKNQRPRGTTKISSKHQVTIPSDAMERTGLVAGDRLVVSTDGTRVILERESDPLEQFIGSMPGVWEGFDLDASRDEWS